MIVSTNGRYALRVMIDLAEHRDKERTPLKEIAERQCISQKYIEAIMTLLSKHGFVDAVHGKGGGYKLTREPDRYDLWEILSTAEGDLAPVECLKEDGEQCSRSAQCRTLPVWENYYKLIKNYFSGITLADLLKNNVEYDYII